ncbi:MAG TPA: DUF2784 domain-containing protein [Burkholderiales bacterium]|nr:DUF2784 domain-containing protein [Burkholderiales bacterium]
MNGVWADLLLALHFGFVAFVVGGLLFILVGALLDWQWIRNPLFRYAHLAAIVFVAAEALVGMACPLTVWEDRLRGTATDQSFIERWLGRALYYDFPAWVFTLAYVSFAALVAYVLWRIPPRPRSKPL